MRACAHRRSPWPTADTDAPDVGRRAAWRRATGVTAPPTARTREQVRPYLPVHVTLRMAERVWNLRSERSFAVIHGAIAGDSATNRCSHRSLQRPGEPPSPHRRSERHESARRTPCGRSRIRLARGLNRMMGRNGPVFADRFHAHVLRTPAEVRHALRYVIGNFAGHAARRGEPMKSGWSRPLLVGEREDAAKRAAGAVSGPGDRRAGDVAPRCGDGRGGIDGRGVARPWGRRPRTATPSSIGRNGRVDASRSRSWDHAGMAWSGGHSPCCMAFGEGPASSVNRACEEPGDVSVPGRCSECQSVLADHAWTTIPQSPHYVGIGAPKSRCSCW